MLTFLTRRVITLSALRVLMVPSTMISGLSSSAAAGALSPQKQCAVIGCGVLGTSFCKQVLASPDFEGWSVTGITKTTNNHQHILDVVSDNEDRFEVATMDDCKGRTFDNVVFCAPPSGFDDYAGAVKDAVTNVWSGLDEGGTFVFTSSGGIHGPGKSVEVELITEETPPADPEGNPRTARLVYAEEACREKGGCCIRLAGLYTLERGAHSFWLNSGKDVTGRADGLINLLHYDDAAGAAMAALKVGSGVVQGRNFLISDSHPLTRQEICQSAMKARPFADKKMPKFLGSESDPKGKLYDGKVSEKDLEWKPRYESFDAFCIENS